MRNLYVIGLLSFCVAVPAGAQTTSVVTQCDGNAAKSALAEIAAKLEGEIATLTAEDREFLTALYHHLGKTQQAVALFEQNHPLKQPSTASMSARQRYTEDLLSLGRHAYAMAILRRLDAQDPKNPKILYLLGIGHLQFGDMKEGMSYLKMAADLHYSQAHLELGKLTTDSSEKQFHYRQVVLHEERDSPLAEQAAMALLKDRGK